MHKSKMVDLPAHCTLFENCHGSNGPTDIQIKYHFCANSLLFIFVIFREGKMAADDRFCKTAY